MKVEFNRFRDVYKDEYTGEKLPEKLVRAAIIDELRYFCEVVWEGVPKDKASTEDDYKLIRGRCVFCNKGDDKEPDVRAMLVAIEVGKERCD